MVRRDKLQDLDLSVRFKYGIHTIVLFVDPESTFSNIAEELLEILRERYPRGLSAALANPKKTELPDDHLQIEFAKLKRPSNPSSGWIPLKAGEKDTPATKEIKNNGTLAFAFRPQDAAEDDDVVFKVEVYYDDEGYQDS
ncbi:hypothetical protein GGR54DRAFT_601270 [Hypoxylon sp. NC1633]|nr:hypothetical protein GGR54DRAFT_601270 [Hypoxylon sp. NC1633]